MARDYAKVIAGLIANSEDETYSEEVRATYRLKAEQIMRDYRIEEEDALAQDATAARIIKSGVLLMEYGKSGAFEFYSEYQDMLYSIAKHCGVRLAVDYQAEWEGHKQAYVGFLVGYEMDVRYAEFLWTAVRLMFSTRVDARKNDALSDQVNAYFLRSSGKSRAQVAYELWKSDPKDGAAHGKVQKLYLAECAKRREPALVTGRTTNAKQYREVYAQEFQFQVSRRLRAARDAADSIKGGIVLKGRAERVDEAFYEMYPQYRPKPPKEASETEETDWVFKGDCPKCKANKSGNCKDHPSNEMTKAEKAAYDRRWNSPAARAGAAAAENAASQIEIQRGHTRTSRLDASGKAISN